MAQRERERENCTQHSVDIASGGRGSSCKRTISHENCVYEHATCLYMATIYSTYMSSAFLFEVLGMMKMLVCRVVNVQRRRTLNRCTAPKTNDITHWQYMCDGISKSSANMCNTMLLCKAAQHSSRNGTFNASVALTVKRLVLLLCTRKRPNIYTLMRCRNVEEFSSNRI